MVKILTVNELVSANDGKRTLVQPGNAPRVQQSAQARKGFDLGFKGQSHLRIPVV